MRKISMARNNLRTEIENKPVQISLLPVANYPILPICFRFAETYLVADSGNPDILKPDSLLHQIDKGEIPDWVPISAAQSSLAAFLGISPNF